MRLCNLRSNLRVVFVVLLAIDDSIEEFASVHTLHDNDIVLVGANNWTGNRHHEDGLGERYNIFRRFANLRKIFGVRDILMIATDMRIFSINDAINIDIEGCRTFAKLDDAGMSERGEHLHLLLGAVSILLEHRPLDHFQCPDLAGFAADPALHNRESSRTQPLFYL